MKKDILLIFFIFLYSNTFSQSISFETTYGFAQQYDAETGTFSSIENLEFNIANVQAIYFNEIISPLFTIRLTPFKTWTFSYILCMLVAFTIFSKLKKINLISAMI